jgi:murein DD-endopeptidase MepM/ murein hydrolase activator NlpD
MASYTPDTSVANPTPPARSATSGASEVTGTIPQPNAAGANKWRWDGGTAITVVPGDTIDSISRRYGVPGKAIIQANNLSAPATLRAGQQLVIPRYQAARAPVTQPKVPAVAAASAPVAGTPAGAPGVHVVTPGETLIKISRLYGKSVAELARANNLPASARLTAGAHLVVPGVRTSAAKPTAAPAVAETTPATQVADATANASVFAPASATPATANETSGATATATEGAASLPKFRWPANGRVVAAFGPTTNGQQNDGINIAVPENTPVKAAEDGVVAYAGNELKGYGNLVLVRHPNGYVTAYAHAKELLVKRGDQVKRGQVIARSGQSGNVNAPQLHFEIRKGSSPVDPTKLLSGA